MRHGETMRYLSTTDAQQAEMLRTIGVGDRSRTLLERIPAKARLGRDRSTSRRRWPRPT